MLWPKQVINISGPPLSLIVLFQLIPKPVPGKLESIPALLNQGIVILSHCNNSSHDHFPKCVVYSLHISSLIMKLVMAGAGERFEENT